MLIGYARVSKADGSQSLDPQRDALIAAGVDADRLYVDHASSKRDDRPGLAACLQALREGDTLVTWRLDRLGCDLGHLVATVRSLEARRVGFNVLTGQFAEIDAGTAGARPVFGIFAALAEFERDLIQERVMAGLAAARARGRRGGAPYKMTPAKLRLVQTALGKPETSVRALRRKIGVSSQTPYRHLSPQGVLRPDGRRLTERTRQ